MLFAIRLNKKMKKENKKNFMFIDNCTAHIEIPTLKNIKIKYLPPNTNYNHWTTATSKVSKCIIGR